MMSPAIARICVLSVRNCKEGLSFLNLVDAHLLVSIRRGHNISLLKVREALDYVKRDFKIDHPLLPPKSRTGGVDLFVEELKALLNVTTHVFCFDEIMRAYLKRIHRDVKDVSLTDEKRLREAVFYLEESIYSRVLALRDARGWRQCSSGRRPAPIRFHAAVFFGIS